MPDHSNNYITAESKCPDSSTTDDSIQINLADNFLEVRGFGQPIPIALAKKMAKSYFDSFSKVLKILDFIDKNEDGAFDTIKQNTDRNEQFEKLKMMMNPEKHIVSGVFGKEIILQLIAQKNCEGIRYIVGSDDDHKMTVILAGVKETNYPDDEKNYIKKKYQDKEIKIKKSEILPFAKYFQDIKENESGKPTDPPIGEVHLSSLTVKELNDTLNIELYSDVNQVLFGEF